MIKYNNTNNASTTLTAGISASSTTLIVENGAILPAVPFLLTLEHFDNEKVTVREIVKCIAKADNILTIQRGAGTCVQDDSASTKEQGNSAHSFSVGDCASIYWTSEQVQDIQNEIEKKLDIDDFQAGTYVYGATSTETDAYSITIPGTLTSYSVGQVFRFMADVDNEGNATLNINGLGAVEIRKNHDKILDNGDIEAGQIVEVAYDGTYFQMDSQVATVVDLGNINSLKESGVVGERYTLGDELYNQDASEDLDIEHEFYTTVNVGYDKEETHIQRIANGISGNSIDLYIGKVGSPTTNFVVELRKGILVEDTARSYWTGDSTQILASKTISYSSITTDLTKTTITFDDDIILNKGELIDIVCYQSSGVETIKSTSNYFVIGGYSDREGEGNSVNYVDSGIITTSQTIAYVNGDFFYKSILANTKHIVVLHEGDETKTSGTSGYTTFYSFTNNEQIPLNIRLSCDSLPAAFGIVLRIGTQYYYTEQSLETKFDTTVLVNVGQSVTLLAQLGSRVTVTAENLFVCIENIIKKYDEKIVYGKPSELVQIGADLKIVTEGNVNGEWYHQNGLANDIISIRYYTASNTFAYHEFIATADEYIMLKTTSVSRGDVTRFGVYLPNNTSNNTLYYFPFGTDTPRTYLLKKGFKYQIGYTSGNVTESNPLTIECSFVKV